LFTVVDLSTVWVVADVYETDFARIHVGTPASITAAAYPGLTLTGRVAYVDPQVRPDTRTARIRIEVANPAGRLKLGMFVDVQAGERTATPVVLIPASALQPSGAESVVYVATPGAPGRFVERPVRLGEPVNGQIAVISGLDAGEQVVTSGVFFLHAEQQRTSR
jgi:RND family efflux transporter MFP subunit